jgi:hypothetical protein
MENPINAPHCCDERVHVQQIAHGKADVEVFDCIIWRCAAAQSDYLHAHFSERGGKIRANKASAPGYQCRRHGAIK